MNQVIKKCSPKEILIDQCEAGLQFNQGKMGKMSAKVIVYLFSMQFKEFWAIFMNFSGFKQIQGCKKKYATREGGGGSVYLQIF